MGDQLPAWARKSSHAFPSAAITSTEYEYASTHFLYRFSGDGLALVECARARVGHQFSLLGPHSTAHAVGRLVHRQVAWTRIAWWHAWAYLETPAGRFQISVKFLVLKLNLR